MKPVEESFLQELLERQMISADEARELVATHRAIADDGQASLWDVALHIGVVTRPQFNQLLSRLGLDDAGDDPGLDTRHLAPIRPAGASADASATAGGKSLGGYRLVDKLGQGGMGAVYKAYQEAMDRHVAIKVLPRSLASNQEFTGRFLREARAAGRLSHPNIVAGIDAGFSDGYYYLAMEYVEGKNLGERIEDDGALEEDEVIDIGRQMALALDHAHAAGIFHRDVKPDNILVTPDGEAKLCDLGLARSNDDDMRVTQAGVAIGTPFYISPEQVTGARPDARADIYSLGCTLYHMICGFVPFDGENAMQVMQKHLNEQAAPIRDVRPDVSRSLGAIIGKMMSKDPEDRYEVASDLAEDLSKAAEGGVPAALAASMSERRRTADRRRGTGSTRAVKPISRKLRAVETAADEGQEFNLSEPYSDSLDGRRLPVGLIIVVLGIIVMLAAGIATLVIIRQRDARHRETRPAPMRYSPRP